MTPIRVLYLLRSYAAGGAQTVVQLLLTHLPRDKFDVLTIPYETGSEHDRLFLDSLVRSGFRVAPDRIHWRGPRDWFRTRRAIRKLASKYEIDVVHTHDDQSNMLVGIGRQHFPCARVASAYGWFEHRWNLKLKLHYAVEKRWALPNFDCVYTVSNNMRDKIVASGTRPERVRVVHTGIDTGRFANLGRRQAVRSKLGLPQHALVVGTVSRLSVEKGHRYLLSAAHQLLPAHPRLFLLCVGTGNQHAPLRRQAQQLGLTERVCFPGYYEDLAEVLEAMDIFALPSVLDEGFPTSVIEAQAAGLPIVASDIGGTRETIDVGASGLLVRPADVNSLAQALDQLLVDEDRRLRMGARAREWVRDSFTTSKMIDQLAEIYQQVTSTAG